MNNILREKIKAYPYKFEYLAAQVGMSRRQLYRKLSAPETFSIREINALYYHLNIPDRIIL